MAPNCFKCGDEIEGDRYENCVVLETQNGGGLGLAPWRAAGDEYHMHFECVDDPAHLSRREFQKWAAYQISLLALVQSSQVHVHNDLVDALEEIHPGTRAAYEQIVQRGLHEVVSRDTATPIPQTKEA